MMELRIKLMIRILYVFVVYCVMQADAQLVTNASIYNLEKLTGIKNVLNPTNLPILKTQLYRHRGGGITGPAAAQALFIMDTPESHKALKEGMHNIPGYDFGYSIRLANHWQILSPEDIYRFIVDYHLTNIPNGIAISLNAEKPQTTNTKYLFNITLKNTTTNSIRIHNDDLYYGKHLIFISPDKQIMNSSKTGWVFRSPREFDEIFPLLSPKSEFKMEIKGTVVDKGTDFHKKLRMNSHLKCGYYSHKLTIPGKYIVYAYYSIPNELRRTIGDDTLYKSKLWQGMAVSEPVEIEIPFKTILIE